MVNTRWCEPMEFLLGASLMFHAINILPKSSQNWYTNTVFSLPGLSLNPFAVNYRKTVQHQLDSVFRLKSDIINLHNAVNNPLTSHRTHNYREFALPELATVLERYQDRLKAIVLCPRNSAPNIFGFFKQTSIVNLHVITDLVSTRKQKDQNLNKEYYQLHQKHHLELKSLTLVLKHWISLCCFIKKTGHSKLNKRRRRKKKSRRLAAEAAAARLSI